MENHPPGFLLVHPLPQAPHFVGRETELQELRGLWQGDFRGVFALVGLGGAGKTAVAAQFVEDLTAAAAMARPGGLFLWSFYQEPDAGLFLQQAYQYFAGEAALKFEVRISIVDLLYWEVTSGVRILICRALPGTIPYI